MMSKEGLYCFSNDLLTGFPLDSCIFAVGVEPFCIESNIWEKKELTVAVTIHLSPLCYKIYGKPLCIDVNLRN